MNVCILPSFLLSLCLLLHTCIPPYFFSHAFSSLSLHLILVSLSSILPFFHLLSFILSPPHPLSFFFHPPLFSPLVLPPLLPHPLSSFLHHPLFSPFVQPPLLPSSLLILLPSSPIFSSCPPSSPPSSPPPLPTASSPVLPVPSMPTSSHPNRSVHRGMNAVQLQQTAAKAAKL